MQPPSWPRDGADPRVYLHCLLQINGLSWRNVRRSESVFQRVLDVLTFLVEINVFSFRNVRRYEGVFRRVLDVLTFFWVKINVFSFRNVTVQFSISKCNERFLYLCLINNFSFRNVRKSTFVNLCTGKECLLFFHYDKLFRPCYKKMFRSKL